MHGTGSERERERERERRGIEPPPTDLQAIDVLRVAAQQQALVVEQLDEMVRGGGPKTPGKNFACQTVERLRILPEIFDIKDRLRAREIVLLKVVVEPGAGCPEVRYAGGDGDSCRDVVRCMRALDRTQKAEFQRACVR